MLRGDEREAQFLHLGRGFGGKGEEDVDAAVGADQRKGAAELVERHERADGGDFSRRRERRAGVRDPIAARTVGEEIFREDFGAEAFVPRGVGQEGRELLRALREDG